MNPIYEHMPAAELAACLDARERYVEKLEADRDALNAGFIYAAEQYNELAAQRDELLAALRALTEAHDRPCLWDVLNPCWDNRATDIPGKHWGVGDACPLCTARAAISKAEGGAK